MIIYVPKSVTDAVKSRPDWPELEAAMKRAYGADWRLVSYDEMKHPAEAGEMEDSMEHEYISRKELIVWLMPYLQFGELVDPEVLIEDIRAMKAADVAPVVHGKWAHLGGDEWCCTNCGNVISTEGSWEHPYQKCCPNCGAKMDKED